MWKKLIKPGEKVGLELTQAERNLLLTGLVFLHEDVEAAIRSTPPGEEVMLTISDLEDLVGHVAGEANHAKSERIEEILSGIFEKIEELLDLYAEEKPPARAASLPDTVPSTLDELPASHERIIIPMPRRPDETHRTYPIKMTPLQRESLLDHTGLRPGLTRKIEQTPAGTRSIEFTREELDELDDKIGEAIASARSPHKARLMSISAKIGAIFEQESDEAFGITLSQGRKESLTRTAMIYQFKVTLTGSDPPIWRRFQVPDLTLGELHDVLQAVMGWEDSHLHQFVVSRKFFGPADTDNLDMEVEDEDGVLLSQIVTGRKKSRFVYEYDFGDSWEHEIVLEKTLEPEPKVRYPRCLDGARACPPEDVGGVWGYADFLEAMANPKHPDHRDMKSWIGGKFDPEGFSSDKVNKELRKV